MTKTSTKSSKFVYTIYIRTTPEQLWNALTKPEFTKQYWFGSEHETNWKPGSSWKLNNEVCGITDSGEVLEADQPHRLVLKWRHELMPDMNAEGYSLATIVLEPAGEAVKLTVTHEIDRDNSKLINTCSGGWQIILSSLKSLLETGKSLEQTRQMPAGF